MNARSAALARSRAIGESVGAAYRSREGHLLATAPAFRAGLAAYDRGVTVPAYRSAADDRWVAEQIARRDDFVRRVLAPLSDLDPDQAVEAARTTGLGVLLNRSGHGRLAI